MRSFTIDGKSEGKKIFNFLKVILPGIKNTEIFKMLRKKVVTVNEKKTERDYTVKKDDVVKVFLKDEHFEKKGRKEKFRSVDKNIEVVFEDNDIIAVNKPAGVLSHPDINEYKNNLYEMVRSYLYAKGEYDPAGVFSPAPCHRLDKNTSGLIVFAKNHNSLKSVAKEFRERETIKTYCAIVFGRIDRDMLITSVIDDKEQKVNTGRVKTYKIIPDKTDFLEKNRELSASLILPVKSCDEYSLINIELWTGKKHQIRAQLTAVEHPLLGDRKYFSKHSNLLSLRLNFGKYYLHSYKLKLKCYSEWTASMPGDFSKMIEILFK